MFRVSHMYTKKSEKFRFSIFWVFEFNWNFRKRKTFKIQKKSKFNQEYKISY